MIIFDKDRGYCPDIRQVVLQTYDIYALEKIIDRIILIPKTSLEDILYDFLDDPEVHLNSYYYNSEECDKVGIIKEDYAEIVDILKNYIVFSKNRPRITFNNIGFKITIDSWNNIIFNYAVFKNCEFEDSDCIKISFINTIFENTRFGFSNFIHCNFVNTRFLDCIYTNCYFYGSDFRSVTNPPYIPFACPSEGGFIGWKKASTMDNKSYALIKLYIPADAKRSSATGNKCRCSRAKVLDITTLDGKQHFNEAMSITDLNFIYKVGEYVIPDWFDPDRWDECSNGIHFFINKQDAINY